MIGELGIVQYYMTIHCYNQSTIHLVDNQFYHERRKHKYIRLHSVREVIESREVKIEKIASEENPVDVF